MFYGWKLVLLSSLCNLMLQGGVMYAMNAFLEPLCETYHWSRTALSTSMGIAAFTGLASMPFMAQLSLRFSLRSLMTAGAVIGGAALILMGHTGNLYLFTLYFCLAWIAGQACGGVVSNALISNWFVSARGRAFGLACMGTSFSGAILPFAALLCINAFGLQTAYALLGCITLALAPCCLLLVHDKPQTMGLVPDGIPRPAPAPAPQRPACSFREMLHRPEAYAIGLAFGIGLMSASSIMSQLKPRFAELGFSGYTAMALACTAALFCGLSKYFWGWLCDRINPLLATRLLLLVNILALGLALVPLPPLGTVLFSIWLGFCFGGFWAVLPAIVSWYFGGSVFVSAYRFVTAFIILKSCGYPILGLSYDLSGSYDAAYMIFIALLLTGLLMVLRLDKRQAAEYRP